MPERLAYGMGIKSDLSFDALPLSEPSNATIQLDIRKVSSITKPPDDQFKLSKSQGRNVYTIVGEHTLSVGIASFLQFELHLSTNRISCEALDIVSDELIRYWVLQQIIPLFLLWSGSLEFLHGMAVSVASAQTPTATELAGSPCVGFLGNSFAGKSTLLEYFLSRGHALVSDEHLPLSRQTYRDVIPAIPYYRPYREGENLGFISNTFSPVPRPLQRLFLLEPAPPYADVEFQTLTGLTAIAAIQPHIQYSIYNVEIPQTLPLVAERFKGLADLVRQVPVKRLYVPRSLSRLSEVYDLLLKEMAS